MSGRTHYLLPNEDFGHRTACGMYNPREADGTTSSFADVKCTACWAAIREHNWVQRYGTLEEVEMFGSGDRQPGTAPDDPVNHPQHYTLGGIEVIDAIEAWSLGFHLGNAVKYIARADHKGKRLEDLKKARWYLDREIERLEKDDD